MGKVKDAFNRISADPKLGRAFLKNPKKTLEHLGLDPDKMWFEMKGPDTPAKYRKGVPEGRKLSEKEMEMVAGGHHNDSHNDYKASSACSKSCPASNTHTDYNDTHFDLFHYWDLIN